MYEQPENKQKRPNTTSKSRLENLTQITDLLVYGGTKEELSKRDQEIDKLVSNTLRASISNQFGPTDKPLEYFSLNMLNSLWSKTDRGSKSKSKNFDEVLKQYAQDSQTQNDFITKIKYDNYRKIYTYLPAAHVALNIYKSSILSPESLTDEPINFIYNTTDDHIKTVMEKRIKTRIIDKYKLNQEMAKIVKESLIDGVSYRAIISIEKDLQDILRTKKVLTEDVKASFDNNYINTNIKFYDSEISKEQANQFNHAIRESVNEYISVAEKYINSKNVSSNNKEEAKKFITNMKTFTEDVVNNSKGSGKTEIRQKEYSGVEIGRFVRDLINENVEVRSKYDFMQDYQDALNEGFEIDVPLLNEDGTPIAEEFGDQTEKASRDTLYLNGSKIITLDPEKVTPIRIGDIVVGYIYTERDTSMDPMTMGGGVANLHQAAPVSFGVNTFGSTGISGMNNTFDTGKLSNPLTSLSTSQTASEHIVNLFVSGLGKKLNKGFIKNNKELKDLIHGLLREKYITQKKIFVTFFSSDDVVETRVKPLFEGSEFFAKLYLAELTNNITISLGRGMDRRMIKVPFGLDDDMYQTVQDAIRTFRTGEFSVGSIDEASISNLVKNSFGRYEDMYIPVAPDGTMGYDVDILPGMDNTKSSELLPQLRNQFLDSINIPSSAIDSMAETDFSRTIALRNVYFSKDIVDYQRSYNETIVQIIRKIYTDEYRYNGNVVNDEPHISLDNFDAWFSKPYSLDISSTIETMQNVDAYANIAVSVVIDINDPANIKPAFKLKQKIFKDTMSYLPWGEWEKYYEESKVPIAIEEIKKSGKKSDPTTDDPNDFNPDGGFKY